MEIVLNIDGMSCGHCVSSITDGLKKVPGVSRVSIDLEHKNAHISYAEDQLDKHDIIRVIEDLGYSVSTI